MPCEVRCWIAIAHFWRGLALKTRWTARGSSAPGSARRRTIRDGLVEPIFARPVTPIVTNDDDVRLSSRSPQNPIRLGVVENTYLLEHPVPDHGNGSRFGVPTHGALEVTVATVAVEVE